MQFLRSYSISITLALSVLILALTLSQNTGTAPGLINDKLAHFMAFAALVFPVSFAQRYGYIWAGLWGLGLGAAIEIVQPYVGRQGDIMDFIADLIGVLVGILCAKLLARYVPYP